ncbi:SdpI family protein [Alkalicoccobacillus gibsonii]|uniref:SdpI family protein n=1 Tax=Alkalicoccobacillus gibsonii TaxID=79881 RepID=UPI001932D9C6|nr:SdpI family protein [Alkalicoccobacillus gibsonii]MBM0064848.1 SdpI family protein [Alkalicoccobacillus gibsonii]
MRANIVGILLILSALILSVATYPRLPDQLAVHWTGEAVTGSLPTLTAVSLMPIVMVILFILAKGLTLLMSKQAQNQKTVSLVELALLGGLMSILFVCHLVIILTGSGLSLDTELIFGISLGLLLMVLGNVMPQLKRNMIFGARNQYTLKNDKVWSIVNRFAGWAFFICGLFIVIGVIIIPSYQAVLIVSIVLFVAVVVQFYSRAIYKRVTSN